MMIPKVHSNGTSLAELLSMHKDAAVAVGNAIDALGTASPHARDYYVKGPDAFKVAQEEHRSRMERLQSVARELREIYEGIIEDKG